MNDDYNRDFYAWTQSQGAYLRRRDARNIDWENLAEEIEAMGRQERRKLMNRLRLLLGHLLKWQYRPDRRSRSWEATIAIQPKDIADLLKDNPSLKSFLDEAFVAGYERGLLLAIGETDLPAETFPIEPPSDFEYALNTELDSDRASVLIGARTGARNADR
ncbi:MAG: DUF29 domain-containing protein [Geitlerinemataceae cyanobacterium]